MATNPAPLELGQQAPPPGGYSIELFEGYLDEMEAGLGNLAKRKDHRSVFELTYLVFSRQILDALKARRFEDMKWTTDMACRFIEVYRYQLGLWERRDPSLCRPWRVAFQAMEDGRIHVLQAMLLGINAHINYDLAFVTLGASRHAGDLPVDDDASSGLTMSRRGVPTVRYRDFLVINQIEWEAIELVQDAVLKGHNQLLYWANRLTMRATRFMGQRILMEARDSAWYQMTLLVHASNDGERDLLRRLIDARAADLADLIQALSPWPDEMFANAVSWIRRGERIDPELQSRLVGLVASNPVVADLGLRELAAGGADPVAVLLALVAHGDVRAAGIFGRMVLQVAPRRAKLQLLRFLERGNQQAVTVLEALLHDGISPSDLSRSMARKKAAPMDVPMTEVRRRWSDQLAQDRACMSLPAVHASPTLRDALAGHVDRLQARLDALPPVSSNGSYLPAARQIAPTDAGQALAAHPDAWVRACARAALGSAPENADGEAMDSTIERVLFLKETEIFREVDVPSLVYVAEHLELRTYAERDTLVHGGRHSGGLYVIADGQVAVVQHRDGRDVVIAQLGPREAVGELSALNDTPATADCRAIGAVRCYFLPTAILTRLLHKHPRLAIGVICMLSRRLVATTLRVSASDASGADHGVQPTPQAASAREG